MSGHSKWSTIKHQKAATDAKRSQVFGKLTKLISVAARNGEDPSMNPDLRSAIDKAKSLNMPSDNIDRAIKKGSGKAEGSQLESVRYEAYGPSGVAIIIDGITDNKNRTTAEIKHILTKHGASLAESGSALWAFEETSGALNPKTTTSLSEEDASTLDRLLEELDDHDDIQGIYTNAGSI